MKAILAILLLSASVFAQNVGTSRARAEVKAKQLWGPAGYAQRYAINNTWVYQVGFADVLQGSAYGNYDRAFLQVTDPRTTIIPFPLLTTPPGMIALSYRIWVKARPCVNPTPPVTIFGSINPQMCQQEDAQQRLLRFVYNLCSQNWERCQLQAAREEIVLPRFANPDVRPPK